MVPMQRVWPLGEFSVPSPSSSSSLPSSSGILLDTLDTDDNDVGLPLFLFFTLFLSFVLPFFFSFCLFFSSLGWGSGVEIEL